VNNEYKLFPAILIMVWCFPNSSYNNYRYFISFCFYNRV